MSHFLKDPAPSRQARTLGVVILFWLNKPLQSALIRSACVHFPNSRTPKGTPMKILIAFTSVLLLALAPLAIGQETSDVTNDSTQTTLEQLDSATCLAESVSELPAFLLPIEAHWAPDLPSCYEVQGSWCLYPTPPIYCADGEPSLCHCRPNNTRQCPAVN